MAQSNSNFLVLSWILAFCFSALEAQKTLNVIDSCWRKDPNWARNRQALANCAKGFGQNALGGKTGRIYVVNDPSDDARNPKPGTLRYGVIQIQPLWIVFARDMTIKLQNELLMNSYKTIDGRGFKVEIANGPCITIENIQHVIIHGLSIHDCKPGIPGEVRCTPTQLCGRRGADGDGISIFAASNIWVDHCYLANCADGLVDIIHASQGITVSNNYLTKHDKAMLLGHDDSFTGDRAMRVTVALNHFGPGLVQRMPRVRLGYAHVANNFYEKWLLYAIGGSGDPTIFSDGNYFVAPDNEEHKEVTKRDVPGGPEVWGNWKWISSNKDAFINGAFFRKSGRGDVSPHYSRQQSFNVAQGSAVPSLTADAGPLRCVSRRPCS